MAVSREERSDPRQSLRRLARAYELPEGAVEQFTALLALIARDHTAPTTVRSPELAVDVHVADSLAALELAEVRGAGTMADLGSGPGFPGLALAVALPRARVCLVESASRKCAFLQRAIEACAVTRAEVVCRRAEAWAPAGEGLDLATARALAPLAVVAEYAAPLLRLGGALVAWKGARDRAEEEDGAAAARLLGLRVLEPVAVSPYLGSRDRWLHRFVKGGATPDRFPRRPGMARKRPLRASSADSGGAPLTFDREWR